MRIATSHCSIGLAVALLPALAACGSERIDLAQQALTAPATLTPSLRRLYGQPNLHEGSINRVVGNLGLHIAGVHVDRSRTPNAIYVADSGNNRILAFDAFGHCSNQRFRRCTLDADCRLGGSCVNEPQRMARLVLGQPSLGDHGACNGDVAGNGIPSRRSLCLLGPNLITPAESSIPIAMSSDARGNLYVPDVFNNRVLRYNDPFASDTQADDVIGQSSYAQNACNKGLGTPGPDTLCLDPSGLDHAGGSVDVDAAGNVWVADLVNSRVLRFPRNAHTANLVLGQPDFASNAVDCSTPRPANVMCRPVDVRVKSTGEVYVVDQYPSGDIRLDSGQSRVLVFTPPLSNGMNATRVMSFPVSPTLAMARLRNVTFDPAGQGDVWISDLYKLVLFDQGGNPLTVIGKPDVTTNAFNDDYFIPGQPLHPAYDPKRTYGGVGVDAAGNLYVAGDIAVQTLSNEVVRFPTPVPTSFPVISGVPGVHLPNGSLMTSGWNSITAKTVRDDLGMTAIGRQLFVGDSWRILVFDRRFGGAFPSAEHVIGCTQFGFCPNSFYGLRDGVRHLSRDASGRLWVAAGRWIQVFQTPIVANDPTPLVTLKMSGCDASDVGPCLDVHWGDDASPVNTFTSSVVYDAASDALWVADNSRRVLHIAQPLTLPVVDLVIGQPDKGTTACNSGVDPATASSVCDPSYVALDNFRNLYVVDSNYEGGGNRRLLEFDAASVLPVPGNLFPLPAAARVYGSGGFDFSFSAIPACDPVNEACTPIAVSFDAQNRLILSVDSYENAQYHRLFIYDDPLASQTPDSVVNFPLGQAAPTLVDGRDLLVQDHTWNRVMDFRYPL